MRTDPEHNLYADCPMSPILQKSILLIFHRFPLLNKGRTGEGKTGGKRNVATPKIHLATTPSLPLLFLVRPDTLLFRRV